MFKHINKLRALLSLRTIIIVAASLFYPLAAQYKVSGGSGTPYKYGANGTTEIYLLYGMEGAQIEYTSSQTAAHQWYRYEKSIDDAVPISCSQEGNKSVITNIEEGYGYYVNVLDINRDSRIWIIDYSRYVPSISNLHVIDKQDSIVYLVFEPLNIPYHQSYNCNRLELGVNVKAAPIYYYVNGTKNTLSRKFLLTYNTLLWQENERIFVHFEASLPLNESDLSPEIKISDPPLINTCFTLTDLIAAHFGVAQPIISNEYHAIKVEAHGFFEKERELSDNEKTNPEMESSPIGYTFTAYANDPVATYYTWKVRKRNDDTGAYDELITEFAGKVFRYTFENAGSYKVWMDVDDAQSVCTCDSIVSSSSIDGTNVIIPNVFSPGSSRGANDELKIQFRSVLSFRASVYNRWGNLLYQWNDPAKGWNGTVNGKYVPTGVYFVVVEYTDSEGKKRKTARDVSILRERD